MVDKDLILAKASAIDRHLNRVHSKADTDIQKFLEDTDRQDIVLFNLQMAIQNCIDIAAHIISDQGMGVPGSSNDMFYILEENHIISRDLAEKMVKAVGCRNLITHEYGRIDLEAILHIAQQDTQDLRDFVQTILRPKGGTPLTF